MNAVQFIEPQQRFTIRKDPVTIGTGVFTKLHPPRTEAEKDKKAMKAAMKVCTILFSNCRQPSFHDVSRNNLCP